MVQSSRGYLAFLVKRRAILFSSASGLLFIIIISFALLMGESPDPAVYNIFFLLSSVVINLVAALLWYSLLVAHAKLEKSEPLMQSFPFLQDKSEQIYVIFASVPSATGHQTTGIGEARGLGILLESLSAINYPTELIHVNYSSKFSDEEMADILDRNNVILLGGPNFNKFSRRIFDSAHERLPFVFMEKARKDQACSGSEENDCYSKCYSGAIVSNTIRHTQTISAPEPSDVQDDASVTKDCGTISLCRVSCG